MADKNRSGLFLAVNKKKTSNTDKKSYLVFIYGNINLETNKNNFNSCKNIGCKTLRPDKQQYFEAIDE